MFFFSFIAASDTLLSISPFQLPDTERDRRFSDMMQHIINSGQNAFFFHFVEGLWNQQTSADASQKTLHLDFKKEILYKYKNDETLLYVFDIEHQEFYKALGFTVFAQDWIGKEVDLEADAAQQFFNKCKDRKKITPTLPPLNPMALQTAWTTFIELIHIKGRQNILTLTASLTEFWEDGRSMNIDFKDKMFYVDPIAYALHPSDSVFILDTLQDERLYRLQKLKVFEGDNDLNIHNINAFMVLMTMIANSIKGNKGEYEYIPLTKNELEKLLKKIQAISTKPTLDIQKLQDQGNVKLGFIPTSWKALFAQLIAS